MKKILVIEDSIDVSSNIEYMLTKAGYSVFVANDGSKGVAMAKEKLPDLIIMDVMLPDIQGGEAVTMIKTHPSCKNIPVIFLTGLMSSGENKEGVETINVDGKAYPALGKPFDFPQLLKAIERYQN